MKILFLGNENSPLISFLENQSHQVTQTSEKLNVEDIKKENYQFLISYSYRHILKKEILELFPDRAINLHISYLPWNKGADPNLWSYLEDTPKGVTIHHLDEGIDTGDIIFQKEVDLSHCKTLKSSYDCLQLEIQNLFYEKWDEIKRSIAPRIKQDLKKGSLHKSADKQPYFKFLTQGWDTEITRLPQLNRKK